MIWIVKIPQGRQFADVINEANAKIGAFVRDSEEAWKAIYPAMINELVADNKKAQEEKAEAEAAK